MSDYVVKLAEGHKGEVLIPGLDYHLSPKGRTVAYLTEEQYHKSSVAVLVARGILIEQESETNEQNNEAEEQDAVIDPPTEINPNELDNEKTQNAMQAWDFNNGKLLDLSDSKQKTFEKNGTKEQGEIVHVDVDETKATTKEESTKKPPKKRTRKTTKKTKKRTRKKVASKKKPVNELREAFESLHADPLAEDEKEDLDFVYDNEPEEILFVDQEQEVERAKTAAGQNEEVE